MATLERTLMFVKPDGVRRGLVGEVVHRVERKGLKIVALRMLQADERLAGALYAEHEGKPFYDALVSFVTSGPIVAMALEAPQAHVVARSLMGATDPVKAAPGTIRGDYGLVIDANVVHGSDSTASAERELSLFFPDLPLAED
ncbi:MAG: nucleoside-diphosphate kinase [Actinobacteria bacterium]|nr:MAG: nucleoside-diphosphate kinase [Actinomycetota bacterium]